MRSRAITIPAPDTLRHHLEKNMMTALVQNGQGTPIAIHRTFLNSQVPKEHRKKMLGPTKGGAVRLGTPLADQNELAIGEGIETCLSFQQIINIPTWAALSEGGMRTLELPDPKPSKIYILADIDEEKIITGKSRRIGQEAAKLAAQRFLAMGIPTDIVWPGDPIGKKADFNDLLVADPNGEAIRTAFNARTIMTVQKTIERENILIKSGFIADAIEQTEQILINKEIDIFQRAGRLVRIARVPKTEVRQWLNRAENSPVLMMIEASWLELLLNKTISYQKFDPRKNDLVAIDCPADIPRLIMACVGDWKFRPLAGIIETPTLRPDGSILDKPGYDKDSTLFLAPGETVYPPIPEYPTQQEAIAALEFLSSTIEEFPFITPEHQAAALSAILTALVRKSLRTAPMFLFSAPVMGNGKSLLASTVTLIATGHPATAITHTTDPVEERKRLVAILLEGDQIVNFDNISGELKSDALCSILSEETYRDRILGETRSVTVPTNTLWLATGNNLIVKGDLTTRVIMIKIDAAVENPENRSEFSKDLKEWIPANRGKLVVAGLTILRAYRVAGMPATGLPVFGRFEQWGRVVRDALVWCGLPDACATREEVASDDDSKNELGIFLKAWFDELGDQEITIQDVISLAKRRESPPRDWHANNDDDQPQPDRTLFSALSMICGDKNGSPDVRKVGWFMRKNRGRIFDGLMINSVSKKNRLGYEVWSVRQIYVSSAKEGSSSCRVMQSHAESSFEHDSARYVIDF